MEVLNQKLQGNNKPLNNKNPTNQNTNNLNNIWKPNNQHTNINNNISSSPKPKPFGNQDTNSNTDSINNGHVVNHKRNWKKLTKGKFYYQAQPVVPEDERATLSETIYYED